MPQLPVKYLPGTIKSRQHTKISQAAFTDTDHVRFQSDGRLATIPPYSASSVTGVKGKNRSIYAQRITGTNEGNYYFFGTHSGLYVLKNDVIYNITPLKTSSTAAANSLATNYTTLGSNPLATTNLSSTVVVTHTAHLLKVGDAVKISGATATGGIAIGNLNITTTVTAVTTNTWSYTAGAAATSTVPAGGGAAVIEATNLITLTKNAHGLTDGERVKISGAADTGGILAAAINKEFIIRNVTTNTFTFSTATIATSSVSATGGASTVYFSQIAAGIASQTTASGMGAGLYGKGLYGAGGTSTTGGFSFPRIWSFDAFGNNVVMCPGDYSAGDGQKIYIWDGDINTAPTVLTNAPTTCQWVLVVNNSVVALCGRAINISQIGNGTVWTGVGTYSNTLSRVDLLHSGYRQGEKSAVIHYGGGAILLRYTGDANLWDVSDLYEDDAVVSPQSTARIGQALIWRGRQGFYMYDGNVVQEVENSQNGEWIIQNAQTALEWHSHAITDQKNSEVYFYFTTGTDQEPGDYVILNPQATSFTLGRMQRTAGQRPGMLDGRQYMSNSISSTADVYSHFTKGATTFSWYAETAFFFAENTDTRMIVDEVRPDSVQSGNITLGITARDYAQGSDISYGSYVVTPTTEYVSIRSAGKLLSLRWAGSSEATLGNWLFNIKTRGRL